ncbi:MAG: SHOCT domain-containing protein [Solirubrobacteraceae bacterium]|nr:SHOCT domain-containing protein [Solirubrobacteraceae bacterium]
MLISRLLILLATLLATLSIFATWAREQLLNTDQWVETSTELLEQKEIRDQLSDFLVDELYTNVNVSQQLADRLPENLQPLAPAAAAGVRQGLDRIADRALENPKVQGLWADANRVAHEQFVAIVLDEKSGNVSAENGVVTLDLRSILETIGSRIGLPAAALAKIPESAASIEILRSDELKTAQNVAQLLKTGSYILTFLALGLLILAVFLAKGRRRSAMLLAGWGLVAAGAVVIVGRGIAGGAVVNSLATTAGVEPSVKAAWDIGTSLLLTLGWQAVIIGLGVVVAAWLGGPSRPATATRRFSAPALADRPDAVGIGVAVALLALIAWAPIPALRRITFILLLIVLLVVGVIVLRRQTAREFPDATMDDFSWGDLWEKATGAVGSTREKLHGSDDTAQTAVVPVADSSGDRIAQLERLGKLHDSGVLDDDEFAAEKDRVLHPA